MHLPGILSVPGMFELTPILVTAAILLDVINFLWFGLGDFQPISFSVVWGFSSVATYSSTFSASPEEYEVLVVDSGA